MTPAQMKSQSVFFALSLVLGLSSVSASDVAQAQAQVDGSQPAVYRELVDQGLTEYTSKNFAEARSLFSRAVDIYPSARALRGLGMAEFELRNYGDSAEALQRALDSNVQPLQGALRVETQRLLERAQGFVARLKVAVEPRAATVIVDGMPVQLGPQGNLVLEVGDHTIEFRAEGYVPEKRVVKVRGGEDQSLRIALPPSSDGSDEPRVVQTDRSGSGPLRPLSTKRFFIVPKLTLAFPSGLKNKVKVSCDGSCDDEGDSWNVDRNAGFMIGADGLVAVTDKIRVGLGIHFRLNEAKDEFSDGDKLGAGRILWLPAIAEYLIQVAPSIAIPVRGMFGMALITGGESLENLERNLNDECEGISGCSVKGPPGLGFNFGIAPGAIIQLNKIAVRTDLILGYQWFREGKAKSDDVTVKYIASGILAAWTVGVEL